MPKHTDSRTAGNLIRLAILAGLWWLLAQGQADGWLVGLPAIVLAALASRHLVDHAPPRLSLAGLVGFLGLFLRESLVGGLDVARRTLGPRLRVQPGFRRYRLRVQDRSARVLLVNCISLLPGTLAADLDGNDVELHLLDAGEDPAPQLLRLEQAVAGMFGLTTEMSNE
jgi:multicomponent Na+:H+ antiporter subunit E